MSVRKLKVYGWVGERPREFQLPPNGNPQTREICAATSKAKVARIVGVRGPHALWNLGDTLNDEECAIALAEPGVVFWCPLGESYRRDRTWRRAEGAA